MVRTEHARKCPSPLLTRPACRRHLAQMAMGIHQYGDGRQSRECGLTLPPGLGASLYFTIAHGVLGVLTLVAPLAPCDRRQ